MSDPLIRLARKADLSAIVALLADDHLGQAREDPSAPLDPRYTAAFEALEGDPNQLLAVLEIDGSVVGCLQLSILPGLSRKGMWRGLIGGVRVARALRGQGFGSHLLGWAIDRCRERDCGMVVLTADNSREGAHRLYERLGFEASSKGLRLIL